MSYYASIFNNFDIKVYVRCSFMKNRESTEGIQGEKSREDTSSSGNLVSTIGALESPKNG